MNKIFIRSALRESAIEFLTDQDLIRGVDYLIDNLGEFLFDDPAKLAIFKLWAPAPDNSSVEEQLMEMLSQQIANEIDQSIISSLTSTSTNHSLAPLGKNYSFADPHKFPIPPPKSRSKGRPKGSR